VIWRQRLHLVHWPPISTATKSTPAFYWAFAGTCSPSLQRSTLNMLLPL